MEASGTTTTTIETPSITTALTESLGTETAVEHETKSDDMEDDNNCSITNHHQEKQGAARTTNNSSNNCNINSSDSRFSCNICLEAVREPVVTQCGHLYCWPCLYQWLEPGIRPHERRSFHFPPRHFPIDESRRVCPVCKASCSVRTIVPIYVRNNDEPTTTTTNTTTTTTTTTGEKMDASQEQSSRSIHNNNNNNDNNNNRNDLDDIMNPTISNNMNHYGVDNPDDVDVGLASTSGLRQRRGSAGNSSSSRHRTEEETTSAPVVPARPAATTPLPVSPTRTGDNSNTPGGGRTGGWSSPSANRASLSNGLTLSVQQALVTWINGVDGASGGVGGGGGGGDEGGGPAIPPIHRNGGTTRGEGDPNHQRHPNDHSSGGDASSSPRVPDYNYDLESDSQGFELEFLSRLLIMLGSFVIFCLLLF